MHGKGIILYTIQKTPPIFLFWDLKLVYCQSSVRLICNAQKTKLSHYSRRNALLKLKSDFFLASTKWPRYTDSLISCCLWLCPSHSNHFSSHRCHCRHAPGTSLLVQHFDCCCCGLSGLNAVTWFLRILFRSPHVVKSLNSTPSEHWKNMRELIRKWWCMGWDKALSRHNEECVIFFSFSSYREKPLW